MSLIHDMIFEQIMKGKVLYSPELQIDFPKKREEERMQTAGIPIPEDVKIRQDRVNDIPVEYITTEKNDITRVIYYIHGGGFIYGEPATRRFWTSYMAQTMGYNVVAVDYRLAPEHPFPAGPADCIRAYEGLLKQYDADKIVLLGESAGGNLVLSTLLQAKEKGLALPAAVFAISPTIQYDQEFESYRENLDTDCMVGYLSKEVCAYYLQSEDEELLKNPVAAPYYGDYHGCPPIFLWASKSEVLRDDSILLYQKLKDAGQDCELYLRDHMMHGYISTPTFEESMKDLVVMKKRLDEVMAGKKGFGNRIVELEQ